MGSTLDALRELQDIELQIVDIRRQLAQKERLVKRQSAALQSKREQSAAERDAFRKAQMEVDGLDLDLKGRTAHVNRLREQLNSVRTNKEYAAVLAQLNNEKADASRLETRALQMMEKVETLRQAAAEREEEERAGSARLADLTAQSEQVQRTFSEKLGKLAQQREAASARLGSNVANLFERLSERYEGEVMARIERTHPRRDEFSCGGCHMTLSADVASTLMVRDDVLTCRSCGRILHFEKGV